MPASETNDLGIQVAELRADVRHIQTDTTEIKAELRATNQRLDASIKRTDERFERIERKMDQQFNEMKDSLTSAKFWALGLYIALAGTMFYVMARGFKWL